MERKGRERKKKILLQEKDNLFICEENWYDTLVHIINILKFQQVTLAFSYK